jgi:hypothetical protein
MQCSNFNKGRVARGWPSMTEKCNSNFNFNIILNWWVILNNKDQQFRAVWPSMNLSPHHFTTLHVSVLTGPSSEVHWYVRETTITKGVLTSIIYTYNAFVAYKQHSTPRTTRTTTRTPSQEGQAAQVQHPPRSTIGHEPHRFIKF